MEIRLESFASLAEDGDSLGLVLVVGVLVRSYYYFFSPDALLPLLPHRKNRGSPAIFHFQHNKIAAQTFPSPIALSLSLYYYYLTLFLSYISELLLCWPCFAIRPNRPTEAAE